MTNVSATIPSGESQSSLDAARNNDYETIISTLKKQLETAHNSLQTSEIECKRLTAAVSSRELELSRSSKLISSVSDSNGAVSNIGGDSGRIEQFTAADVANKRIIDQLNHQLDFLNAQLAQKEAQIRERDDKILQFDDMVMQLTHM